MKVLVIGFSKTGTKTMDSAIKLLGYNCYDVCSNFYYRRKEWTKIFTEGGTKEDFYNMYKDVDAGCDAPASTFWEEILEAFPNTKLVFMERDNEEEWLRSLKRTFERISSNRAMIVLTLLSPTARAFIKFNQHIDRIAFGSLPQRFYQMYSKVCPSVALKRYRQHNDSIWRKAPKGQMLKYNVREGWEPLCKFLEIPVPSKPFPHKNKDGAVLEEEMENHIVFRQMEREAIISLSILVLLLVLGLCYFFM